jgi:drug/metabolite transporter (DMT)-like permease
MKLKIDTDEKRGIVFVLLQAVLAGVFPLVINISTKVMPPVLFAGLSVLTASVCFFVYTFFRHDFRQLLNKEAIGLSLRVTFFIIILPSVFIFSGTRLTSGINTAILLQAEVLFTFIIAEIFLRRTEHITFRRVLGAIVIVMGTTLILYNGSFDLNFGDILIILGTLFYPVGNIAAKKAMKLVHTNIVLFFRSFIGGLALVLLSILFENSINQIIPSVTNYFHLILMNGILVMFLSKALWYKGLKRIELTKAIPLAMSYPVFSLIYIFIFLREIPNIYQIAGLLLTMMGVGFVTIFRPKSLFQKILIFFRRRKKQPPPVGSI